MTKSENYQNLSAGSDEIVALLVKEHAGWATAIAKSVARSWNLDWQLDGLDGGAYEALLFCARRFDPSLGVPFRAYARRRIHEASTEEARKSKSWQQGVGSNSPAEQAAREISASLYHVFPELREGTLPSPEGGDEDGLRGSIRQLLTGATLLSAFFDSSSENPENILAYRQLLNVVSDLEPVHQLILFALYWQGQSMRALATEWGIDELSIVREHKELLQHICRRIQNGKAGPNMKLKVRRGLRPVSLRLKRSKEDPPFARFAAMLLLSLAFISQYVSMIIHWGS